MGITNSMQVVKDTNTLDLNTLTSGDLYYGIDKAAVLAYDGTSLQWIEQRFHPITSNYSIDDIIDIYGTEQIENALRKKKLERLKNATNI